MSKALRRANDTSTMISLWKYLTPLKPPHPSSQSTLPQQWWVEKWVRFNNRFRQNGRKSAIYHEIFAWWLGSVGSHQFMLPMIFKGNITLSAEICGQISDVELLNFIHKHHRIWLVLSSRRHIFYLFTQSQTDLDTAWSMSRQWNHS